MSNLDLASTVRVIAIDAGKSEVIMFAGWTKRGGVRTVHNLRLARLYIPEQEAELRADLAKLEARGIKASELATWIPVSKATNPTP